MVTRAPKSILITGASSGVGAGLAAHYATPGTTLFLSGRNQDRLDRIAKSCVETGAVVYAETLDITDREAVAAWVEKADATTPLDLVIANAGISGGTGSGGESAEQADEIFATNVNGVLNTIHPAIEVMRPRRHGQIAMMSSLAGFRGFPGAPAYSASKATVLAYGEALRGSLADTGVSVSVICPGFIKSPLTDVNQFPMPFLMPIDKAVRIITSGLARDKGLIAFPWPTRLFTGFVSCLPSTIGTKLLMRLPEKG